MGNDQPVKVGIAGLGRSGWGIHANAIKHPAVAAKYRIVAVTDPIADRAQEAQATFGCRIHDSFDALIADPEVELVVVATLNSMHAPQSIAALQAGKHVLCEKPMATSLADADRMVQVARDSGRILTINHNMRFVPGFVTMRDVIRSGKLGEILHMQFHSHGFRRRWDWQTLKEFGGGEMNNNASHSVDMALTLLGDVTPQVHSDVRRTPLCAGDADDHVKIMLTAAGAPTVDIMVSNAGSIPGEPWIVLGTQGGLVGSPNKLSWRYFDPTLLPERQPDKEPTPDRSYNREDLPWREETWDRGKDTSPGYDYLYLDLYETLRHGKPPAITPESVRRVVAVLEECRKQSPLYSG